MGTRALEHFFDPKSIAIIGASDRQGSMGGAVVKNLINAGYPGMLFPVNLKRYKQVMGLKAYARLSRLPEKVDLVIICTPESQVKGLLKQCERLAIGAVIILTGGFSRNTSLFSQEGRKKSKKLRCIRVLGPDCYGIMVPHRNLNISYSHRQPLTGNIAYIGQSGTLASAMIDWATERGIGFRYFMTIGDGLDINLADLIDYLAQDRALGAILLQLEHIQESAQFARAIRVCSRRHLVVYVKTKHGVELGLPPEHPPPGIQDRDTVHNAVLKRAGALRVSRLESLFEAAEVLGYGLKIHDLPLIIVSNGLGPARIALDHLLSKGGENCAMSSQDRAVIKRILDRALGQYNHVIDLGFDANPQDFFKVITHLQKHKSGHPILLIHSPNGTGAPNQIAEAIVSAHSKGTALLTCWLGGSGTQQARHLFEKHSIPCLDTPERAIDVYMLLVNHRRSQQILSQTPHLCPIDLLKRQELDELMLQPLRNDRTYFTVKEAFECLRKLRLPVLNTAFADSIEGLGKLKLDKLDKQPVALKIIHGHYCLPFAYGDNPRDRWRGVLLPIRSHVDLIEAAKRLISELEKEHPDSPLHGFSVQPIRHFQEGIQFSMGITQDDEYGPLIFFGGGGSTANIIADRKIELPPMTTTLAISLIKSTHVYKVLKERCTDYMQALDVIIELLLTLSRVAETCTHLKSCELNVFLNTKTLRLQIMGQAMELQLQGKGLCFPPPPQHLSECLETSRGLFLQIRPIIAEDEPKLIAFHHQLSDETLRNRFFVLRRNLSHADFARLTQIDYVREMAFVGIIQEQGGNAIAGVARCFIDPDFIQAEYSLVVRDDLQLQGIGSCLLGKLVRYLKDVGVFALTGETLATNNAMIALAKKQGFICELSSKNNLLLTHVILNKTSEEWQSIRLEQWRFSSDHLLG